MNVSEFNQKTYDGRWDDLNKKLGLVESEAGLPGALGCLRAQQRRQGFIRDDLESVGHYRFTHPHHAERFFLAQYNPARQNRFKGIRRAIPPAGHHSINGGCTLCRQNIQWQQNGIEFGYDLQVGDTPYTAWMNAYPLMPVHVVVASREHIPQFWGKREDASDRFDIEHIFSDLVALTERLPGYIGFYNGEGAGASIPGHFHYQFFKRRDNHHFPLELRPRVNGNGHALINDYPVMATYWRGRKGAVVAAGARWFEHWLAAHQRTIADPSVNLFATCERDGEIEMYVVPRDQARSKSPEMDGLIGGLEILGELVFATADEKRRLDTGEIDYHAVERILGAARVERSNASEEVHRLERSQMADPNAV